MLKYFRKLCATQRRAGPATENQSTQCNETERNRLSYTPFI